jgi:hypothetical protein
MADCVVCTKPMGDTAYACTGCMARAGYRLTEIADMVPAARDIAHGLASHDNGGGHSKPGSRLPLDLGATARLDAVQKTLTKWVDHIGVTRGQMRPWFALQGDPITIAAYWLSSNLEWIRHQPDREPDDQGNTWGAEQFLGDVEACARVVRGIARGPAEQKYLGPCGAVRTDVVPLSDGQGSWDLTEVMTDSPCEGDVYGYPDAATGRCRTCKAEHDQAERRAWLDEQTTDLAAPARDIAYSLGINVKTIRSWATEIVTETGYVVRRAKLRTYYRQGEHVVPWTGRPEGMSDAGWKAETERRGPRLHYVGDVRALAQEANERKAGREATRDQAA